MKPAGVLVDLGPVTAKKLLANGITGLEHKNVPSAALVAELLLMHVLQCDRTKLYAHPDRQISISELHFYSELLERRISGVPLQYLTGKQEFWGLEFEVNPSVLIPRPETEHLIEVVLERLGSRRNDPLQIADVGTGSGCIAVTLARELPNARIVAIDIASAALDVARSNAQRQMVNNCIGFRQMDLLTDFVNLGANEKTEFDVIVSNPPYVGRQDSADLQREVIEHEPHLALFAGEEGLEIYPRLIEQSAKLLRPGGLLAIELGHGLANRVRALVASADWHDVAITDDLAGIPRVLAAKRS
jgi:release factor glutamine methyltransferase